MNSGRSFVSGSSTIPLKLNCKCFHFIAAPCPQTLQLLFQNILQTFGKGQENFSLDYSYV